MSWFWCYKLFKTNDQLLDKFRPNTVNTGRKLNVHKTFRRRRLLKVLCKLNLRRVYGWANRSSPQCKYHQCQKFSKLFRWWLFTIFTKNLHHKYLIESQIHFESFLKFLWRRKLVGLYLTSMTKNKDATHFMYLSER